MNAHSLGGDDSSVVSLPQNSTLLTAPILKEEHDYYNWLQTKDE
jgi:hypothetical protein